MPVDPNCEDTPTRVDQDEKYEVSSPVDEPDQLGVHETHVVVDFDIWNADGACLEDCPLDAIGVDPGELTVFDILGSNYR